MGDMESSDALEPQTSAEVWQERYSEGTVWSGQPNAALVEYTFDLAPGTAMELGSGEGADAIWLAERGWKVTGVDVSATALRRAEEQARARGLDITWVEADLAQWRTDEQFDLVAAFFLHSPVNFPRAEIYKAAADAVAPGGVLLVVGHADFPPWSRHHQPEPDEGAEHVPPRFPPPEVVIEEAELGGWEILAAENWAREVTSPEGERAVIHDSILKARRP